MSKSSSTTSGRRRPASSTRLLRPSERADDLQPVRAGELLARASRPSPSASAISSRIVCSPRGRARPRPRPRRGCAGLLGAVERPVGELEQLVRGAGRAAEAGHADAGRDRAARRVLEPERLDRRRAGARRRARRRRATARAAARGTPRRRSGRACRRGGSCRRARAPASRSTSSPARWPALSLKRLEVVDVEQRDAVGVPVAGHAAAQRVEVLGQAEAVADRRSACPGGRRCACAVQAGDALGGDQLALELGGVERLDHEVVGAGLHRARAPCASSDSAVSTITYA